MTPAEFSKGWKLLLLQPWGWRYRTLTADGKPAPESQAQLEFYYDKLKWADGRAWMKVADLYAQGKDWPSVNELKMALQQVNSQFVKAIGEDKQFEPMPESVREQLAKLGVTITEGQL